MMFRALITLYKHVTLWGKRERILINFRVFFSLVLCWTCELIKINFLWRSNLTYHSPSHLFLECGVNIFFIPLVRVSYRHWVKVFHCLQPGLAFVGIEIHNLSVGSHSCLWGSHQFGIRASSKSGLLLNSLFFACSSLFSFSLLWITTCPLFFFILHH